MFITESRSGSDLEPWLVEINKARVRLSVSGGTMTP